MRVSDSGLGFGPALCSLHVGRQLFPRSPRIYPYLSFLRNTKRYSFVVKICERIASRKMNRSLMDIIKGYVSESIEILLNRHNAVHAALCPAELLWATWRHFDSRDPLGGVMDGLIYQFTVNMHNLLHCHLSTACLCCKLMPLGHIENKYYRKILIEKWDI